MTDHLPTGEAIARMRTFLRSLIDGDDAPIPEAEEMFDEALIEAMQAQLERDLAASTPIPASSSKEERG